MRRLFPLAVLVCSFVTVEGRCELITFAFTGTVTNVDVFVPAEFQSHDFPDVGADPFTGFYTFDSNAPDTASSSERGFFITVLPDAAVSVSIGPWRLEGPATAVQTLQDRYDAGDWSLITPDLQIPNIQLTS